MGSLMILKNLMLEMDSNRMMSKAADRGKDMAKAHITSLICPELAKAFEALKTWVNGPEFTQEHFNIIFEV